MDEYDEDLESSEEEAQPEGFAALPRETQAELKKLRKESQRLRDERRTLQNEVLTTKFGPDVVALIPEELADYERQVAFAEKLQARLGTVVSSDDQTDEATEDAVQEAASPVEKRLATVGKVSPPGAALPEELLTVAQIKELAKTDPDGAEALIREGKFQQQANW